MSTPPAVLEGTPRVASTTHSSVVDLPSDEVRLLHAAVRGEPNRTASLAVDSAGTVHSRRTLEAIAGRDLFAPRFTAAARVAAVAFAAVTVDPPSNDWTLSECDTAKEIVTVTVPPTGAAPRADVHLLADTTGSMNTVLDAVKNGIGAIVADPSFAGLDLAWGAGNYKDFPIPLSSPYAFQHQLAPTPGAAAVSATVATWVNSLDGLDVPEAQLYAVTKVATDPVIGWRADSKRILVWFGDAPGHDPVCSAVSGEPDIDEASATNALVTAGITVVTRRHRHRGPR
jgi:hypothetical protein